MHIRIMHLLGKYFKMIITICVICKVFYWIISTLVSIYWFVNYIFVCKINLYETTYLIDMEYIYFLNIFQLENVKINSLKNKKMFSIFHSDYIWSWTWQNYGFHYWKNKWNSRVQCTRHWWYWITTLWYFSIAFPFF